MIDTWCQCQGTLTEAKGLVFTVGAARKGELVIADFWLQQQDTYLLLVLRHLEVGPISNIDSQTLFHLVGSGSGGSEVVWWETQLLDSDFQHLNPVLVLIII